MFMFKPRMSSKIVIISEYDINIMYSSSPNNFPKGKHALIGDRQTFRGAWWKEVVMEKAGKTFFTLGSFYRGVDIYEFDRKSYK